MTCADDRGEGGFTLIEIMLASALSLVVMVGAFNFLNTSTRAAAAVANRSANSANAREAINALEANLRYANGVWICNGLATTTTCVTPTAPGATLSRTGVATMFVSNASNTTTNNGTQPACDEWTISQGSAGPTATPPLSSPSPGWGGLQEWKGNGTTLLFSIPGVMAWMPPAASVTALNGQTAGFRQPVLGLFVINLLVNSAATAATTPQDFATSDAVTVDDLIAPDNLAPVALLPPLGLPVSATSSGAVC